VNEKLEQATLQPAIAAKPTDIRVTTIWFSHRAYDQWVRDYEGYLEAERIKESDGTMAEPMTLDEEIEGILWRLEREGYEIVDIRISPPVEVHNPADVIERAKIVGRKRQP